jgi:hypothetical protein
LAGVLKSAPAPGAPDAVPESAAAVAAAEPPREEVTISGGLYSASEADEHEDFIQYMHLKDRAFRRAGVSMKQEYELWRAHRAATLSGQPMKKPGLLARLIK